jgi:CO/xanthine dehydrogenase FAD-binding subunit
VSGFLYHRPESVDALRRVLAEASGPVELLAGGTDVLVGIRKEITRPAVVVDLKELEVLRDSIEERDGRLRIGALCVLSDLIADPRIRRHFEALVEAATVVGSVQIRNRATLVGNVCNASPAADTVPALLVYGARVHMLGEPGERAVALDDFFIGPGETVLRIGEIVTSIELPLPTAPQAAAFVRITRRRGFDLGIVSVACAVGAGMPARFGFGAVAGRPLLAVDCSGTLAAAAGDPALEERALADLVALADPISDVRGSREYRVAMLTALSRRALARARERLAEASGGRA